jgi:hypothetical protein
MNTLVTIGFVLYFWTALGLGVTYAYGQNIFNKNWSKVRSLIFCLVVGPVGWITLLINTLGYLLDKSTDDKNSVL